MKFSEKWLREWVNPAISTEELSKVLTMSGLEVEAVEPVAGEFSKVVVGQVRSLEPHPDADKLNVCQVDVGGGELLQIVCGAANVAVDFKAPVALVGARLPGDFKIKKTKLRGVPSFGMLCSATELGMAESADGLMALPADAPTGQDMREYLWLDDQSFELSLTPNRADCLSIAGIAREVGTLAKVEVTPDDIDAVAEQSDRRLGVRIEVEQDCPRYLCQVIEGIDPAAGTPLWIVEALRRSGLRSLGPVVDITNFVLLELGQPMHAFDLTKIDGSIRVRHATAGESLVLLDGQQIELTEGTMVIADDQKPLALAGIMGGQDSAVSDATRSIVLESAFFNPLSIAGRARSYGLHTDSSHRFERGVDPELQRTALQRAASLLLSIVGGSAGPVVEVVHETQLPQRSAITLRAARIRRVLGKEIARDEVLDILQRLGMSVAASDAEWQVTAPSFRFDIEIEEDLIEEIARVHGYDNLPTTLPKTVATMQPRSETVVELGRLKEILVARGYQEAITYSFVDPEMQHLISPDEQAVVLANPISADMSVMRTSLWPGLLQAMMHNLNRQQSIVRFFESGLKFIKQDNEIIQKKYLSGVVTGQQSPEQWAEKGRAVDFFDVKGDVEALLATLSGGQDFSFTAEECDALHPGQSAVIYDAEGKKVGMLGALHPAIETKLDLSQRTYLFELAMNCFDNAQIPRFEPLSKYPEIRRDLSVVLNEATTIQTLKKTVKGAATGLLKNFQLFDVYQGKGIDSGRKSVAFGLTFQDQSRTLEEIDVEAALAPILSALTDQLDATLRK